MLVDSLVKAYDKVMFPTKMREKNTWVALAKGSPMIKLVEFLISLKE